MAEKSTQPAASTALITVDTAIPDRVKYLDEQINALEIIKDSKWKTGGSLDSFGDLTKETKIDVLLRALHSVAVREEGYVKAAAMVGLKKYPAFVVNGGNTEDWLHDIKLRISIIQQDEKLKTLKKFKEEALKFLSEDDQKADLARRMAEFAESL